MIVTAKEARIIWNNSLIDSLDSKIRQEAAKGFTSLLNVAIPRGSADSLRSLGYTVESIRPGIDVDYCNIRW